MKCVFTGFSTKYWNKCGVSWLASLKELARFEGKVLVVSHDLSPHLIEKLTSYDITVLESKTGKGRDRTLLAAESYIAENPGAYIHWDADTYFQDSLDPLFQEKGLISAGLGMIGGNSESWSLFFNFHRAAQLVFPMDAKTVINHFNKYFDYFASPQQPFWNFSDLPTLKWEEGKFTHDKKTVPVIHLSVLKILPDFHFENRYPQIYSRWKNTHFSNKLLLYTKKA